MTSKERVYEALRFGKPDRPPHYLWFSSELCRYYQDKYGLDQLGLYLKYDNDILQCWLSQNASMETIVPEGSLYTDEWNITRKRSNGHNSIVTYPVADIETADDYVVPDPYDPKRYVELEFLLKNYGDTHFIGADVSPILFEACYNICGMETTMMAMMDESDELARLMDRLEDFVIKVGSRAIEMGADWIWLGDDLGSQQSLMISPQIFREQLKPRYKRIVDALRSVKPDIFIAMHSCGSIAPLIADLVEVGINVLNPVQESAANMNQLEIKQKFMGQLSLMCGPDTQQFMVEATTSDIEAETRRLLDTLGAGGGYVFGVSHTLQMDIGEEKIDAMHRVLQTYGAKE